MERAYKKIKTKRAGVKSYRTRGARSRSRRNVGALYRSRRGVASSIRTTNLNSAQGLLGVEAKWKDYFVNNQNISSAADCTGAIASPGAAAFPLIAQGDAFNERDGNRCVLTSVSIKGWVEYQDPGGSLAPPPLSGVFIALVWDTQCRGANLASQNVFSNPSNLGNQLAGIFRNRAQQQGPEDRYRVLKTWHFRLAPASLAFVGASYRYGQPGAYFSCYKKLNIPQTYTNTTAAVANLIDNGLQLLAFSDTGNCYLGYNARVTFVG